jgi:hypothetical protein
MDAKTRDGDTALTMMVDLDTISSIRSRCTIVCCSSRVAASIQEQQRNDASIAA